MEDKDSTVLITITVDEFAMIIAAATIGGGLLNPEAQQPLLDAMTAAIQSRVVIPNGV